MKRDTNSELPTRTAAPSRPPTCGTAGPCRSAVTVAEEDGGTSSVGDLERAGLAFLPSAGGSPVLGVDGCGP